MKKRIISALLALTMVVALPVSTVLADEVVQTDDVTVGQEYPVPETSVEGNENTVEDVTLEVPTEETPADETEVSENGTIENNELQETIDCTEIDLLANGDDMEKSGKCGDNAYWSFENGTLTISGTGEMYDYHAWDSYSNMYAPWYFWRKDIKSVIIENGVTNIGYEAFLDCTSLTSVTILNSVVDIYTYAFRNCASLTSITIPVSVTNIAWRAFEDCTNLTDVYYAGSKSEWEAIYIGTYNEELLNANIHYNSTGPDETTEPGSETITVSGTLCTGDDYTAAWRCSYKLSPSGRRTNAKVQIDVKSDNSNTKTIMLQNDKTQDGIPFPWELAPYNISKSAVTEIVVNSEEYDMVILADYAFKDYTGLKKVSLSSVDCFYYSNFENCTSLEEIEISNFNKDNTNSGSIGEDAFSGCKNLKSTIFIPKNYHIAPTAFEGCDNVTLMCYRNSPAHAYAEERNIKYILINDKYTVYLDSGKEDFDFSLEDMLKKSSTEYSPEMAHMMIAMCNSVYNQNNMFNTFDSFGFKRKLYEDGIYTHYAAAKKEMENGETLVLVVVRGTGDLDKDLAGWASNVFDSGANEKGQHSGFSDAADTVYDGITKTLGISDFSNTTFVITGFSRGAAASNILAARLVDEGCSQEDIYAYTFACPNTVKVEKLGNTHYECIHNISNVNDIVSWVPEIIVNTWTKYGNSYWYCEDKDDYKNNTLGFKAHNQYKYLQYIPFHNQSEFLTRSQAETLLNDADKKRQEETKSKKHTSRGLWRCPVDVEIYTSNGLLAGSVIDNIPNTVLADKVNVYTVGEAKYAEFLEDDEYKIKMTGTDSGTMTYTIQNIDIETNEIIEEQEFANVVLAKGKRFTSNIIVKDSFASEVKTEDIKLYVIDDNGTPKKEVLPDGNGTEIPLSNDGTPTTPATPDKPATPDDTTKPETPDTSDKPTTPDSPAAPDTPNKPTAPDNGGSSSDTNTGVSTSTVIPVGSNNTETMTVKIENKVTGKASKALAKKTGSSVNIKLGTENNGYYVNVYTTNGEYICSALIENGRAKFNVPEGIKIKIVIDSIAYGEDVSSAAGAAADGEPVNISYPVIIVLTAAFGIYFKRGKKHLDHKAKR